MKKKHLIEVTVKENLQLNEDYAQIIFTSSDPLPEMFPGQFVEVKIEGSTSTFLRRPFSINFYDKEKNEFWLLIHCVGNGTRTFSQIKPGANANMILPLGNTFSLPINSQTSPLLIGGGCGVAPLLFWGAYLQTHNIRPNFLLGARSKKDLLQLNEFKKYGDIYLTTEDGSIGEKGYVIQHSILQSADFNHVYTCGPKPMMMAVAHYAKSKNIFCEVSLENTMACGFGVCLCCVENTHEGHVCVCKEGPVFNIEKLLW
ncbi:MAG: dihydroorotate dehydrogenase electron transfer subunit [Candidatus Azobacteroides sp.]|nr:dihydroorotate dehydrogenase electron transfer subunit [Candidatus Azobacteroides sp.]